MLMSAGDVEKIRKHYRLSYKAFSDLTGLSPSLIYHIEKGERALTSHSAEIIVNKFNLNLEKINAIQQEARKLEREKADLFAGLFRKGINDLNGKAKEF